MKRHLIFSILLFSSFFLKAQASLSDKDIKEYESQIHQMVEYLQETLNFIGDPNNFVHEKDIIFKESYSKIFRDENVQVEDDLDENRGTSINKDVQSYLKDIDFFFDNVKFTFEIQSVTPQINEAGETFFKVAMVRTIAGNTLTGDAVNNSKPRFLEINLDSYKKELKIVSFYTTKPNAEEELYNWWNSMSSAWKQYLGKGYFIVDEVEMSDVNNILADGYTLLTKREFALKDSFMIVGNDTMSMDRIDELFGHQPDTVIFINDTVSRWVDDTIKTSLSPIYEILKQITKITEVNVAGNEDITTLEPLTELSELRSLNCSDTKVNDINPIRNLNKIKDLNISNTDVKDISNLKYANVVQDFKADNIDIDDITVVSFFKDLNNLSLANTKVNNITPVSNCVNMTSLNLSGTQITNLSPLNNLLKLYDLDLSNTPVSDISSLQNLVNLHFLNVEGTRITDLSPLKSLERLNEINFSNTEVADLMPLDNMSRLTKIYCDNALVDKAMADKFMRSNPNVLVIYETLALEAWWNELPSFWKDLLITQAMTSKRPTKEELHSIINIKNLKVGHFIQDAEPVSRLTNIEFLDLSDSKIDDLSPLYGLHNLKSLNVRNTEVSDLTPLSNLKNLKELNIENTNVKSLQALHELSNISKIYADGSKLTQDEVVALKRKQRQLTVIYQTDDLRLWWGNLDMAWREIFNSHLTCNSNPTAEQLQSIVDLEEIVVDPNNVVYSLESLQQMSFLRKLIINNNQIHDLTPLSDKDLLEVLSVSGNPVDDITPLSNLLLLKNLNVENTQVSDLTPITNLKNIKVLNIGGTSVRNLKPLAGFEHLEDLSIVNTYVKSVVPLENLPSLKHLKAYKTKIKNKNIELLKFKKPDLNVIYY